MNSAYIETLLGPLLDEEGLFAVEVQVVPDKSVMVFVDGMENVSVKQCARITRFLRDKFEEAGEEYEITVSSPGLDKPFRHPKQFEKSIDKSVEIVLLDGKKLEGKLKALTPDGDIEFQEFLPKKANMKAAKPQLSDKITLIRKGEIRQTKRIVFI